MQRKSLGYEKDQVLVVERAFGLGEKTQTFIDEVKQITGVESVASTYSLMGRQQDFFGNQFTAEGSSEILTTKSMVMDDEFAQTIGFQFVSGHGYSRETNDSLSIILNETAVRTMDIDDPIGKKLIQVQRSPNGVVQVAYTIIGVIKDFNFQTLRDVITPLTIMSNESFGGGGGYIIARVKGSELSSILASVEEKWKLMVPEQPFKYLFLDEDLNAHYDAEKRAGQVFAVFSVLAIVIACVGLFGLSAYTASLRTKEIGVRKVLGATVGSVVMLLSKDFTKLILIAFAFAVPVSWYIMDNWLDGFAYRIDIGIGVFVLAGISALLISWLTVSYQSIKAAIMNPVKSLRSQ
jgi:putative ABC transport system permease protein